jgi:glutamate--cysteine ligase
MTRARFYDENKQRLVSFFRSGTKGAADSGRLGVEVEHFVLAEDGSPISYEPTQRNVGIRNVLDHLTKWYPEQTFNSYRDLLGLLGTDGSITLEPAAQLELSAAPYRHVSEVAQAYQDFLHRVNSFLQLHDAHVETWGYHPTRRAQELALIPKRRYEFMDNYFMLIGSHGDRMMRASASTQVSVDFVSEADAVRKMRVASALSPILAAIADNTHVFEAEPNHVPVRRLALWREVDNARCGTIPRVFEEGFGFDTYAEWLLATSPIFVTRPAADDPAGPKLRPFYTQPAAEAYSDAPLSGGDVEHLVSMFWPDVRLKRFVEVRPADCLPYQQILGYTALIKGLFYSATSLRSIEEELGVDARAAETRGAWGLSSEDVSEAIANVQKHGLGGIVYGHDLASWESKLFTLARAALPENERLYLDPLQDFARDKSWWDVS